MASEYQKTLTLVRAWVAENPGPWDIWHLRHSIEAKAPDGNVNGSTTEVFMQRSLRAVNQLTDEGVLVKQGERNDAIYMTPAVVAEREQRAAAAAGREAQVREEWRQRKMRMAALGYFDVSTSVRDIRLEPETWDRLMDRLEARDD